MRKSMFALLLVAACGNSSTKSATVKTENGFYLNHDVSIIKEDISDPNTGEDATEPDVEPSVEDGVSVEDADPGATDDAVSPDDVAGTEETAEEDSQPQDVPANEVGPDIKKVLCQDDDGDGRGVGCPAGDDCDDYNPNFAMVCPDCSKGNFPGCPCKSKSVPCYSGDPATAGIGICQSGVQTCKDGFFGTCVGEVDPGIEVCDGKDNDCDGETDEGVKSTCGGCDMSCVQKSVGIGSDNKFTLNSENSTGVGLDPASGMIKIDSSQISLNLKFLWASNSPDGTVSKVDCKTAKEVGRYRVCTDPSRTSVDLDGNVWVGCRAGGQVAKIMADKKNCVDKNGNGVIETSEDLNGDGAISSNEMVSGGPGSDECVKFITPVLGGMTRAAGVDKFNNVWIGFWSNKYMKHLKAEDGSVMETVNLPCASYGLVIDQKGVIWVQGSGCGLVSYDPNSKAMNVYNPPWGYASYGINVDGKGRIWLGGSNASSGAASYDPKTGNWVSCQGVPHSAGIATANDGMVYPAHDCGNGGSVGKVDGDKCWATGGAPGSYLGFMKTGGCPHGVAVDFDGYVWGVNWSGSSVGKVDPKNMGNAPVVRAIGSSPYTYSDMTGYTLNYFTAPKGLYTTTFFAGGNGNPISVIKPKAVWQTLNIDGQFPPATYISVQLKSGDTQGEMDASAPVDLGKVDAGTQMPIDLTALANPVKGIMLQVQINLVTEDKKVSPMVGGISAKAKLM